MHGRAVILNGHPGLSACGLDLVSADVGLSGEFRSRQPLVLAGVSLRRPLKVDHPTN